MTGEQWITTAIVLVILYSWLAYLIIVDPKGLRP